MSLKAYQNFVAKLAETAGPAFLNSGVPVSLLSRYDGKVEDLYKDFDRSEEVSALQGLKAKEHRGGEWMALKARCEILAAFERDTRARFRTRVRGYQNASLYGAFVNLVAAHVSRKLTALESAAK